MQWNPTIKLLKQESIFQFVLLSASLIQRRNDEDFSPYSHHCTTVCLLSLQSWSLDIFIPTPNILNSDPTAQPPPRKNASMCHRFDVINTEPMISGTPNPGYVLELR